MRRRLLALLGLLLAAGCAVPEPSQPGPIAAPQGRYAEQLHRVPVQEVGGSERLILLRVCQPPNHVGPRPLVVINHGSPGDAASRRRMQPWSCESPPVQWFLSRGYVAAMPLRRGYGADRGAWSENYGRCEQPDFVTAGLETARDIAAATAYARGLPEVRRDEGAVVVGQSAGGWGVVALASLPVEGVAGMINFAGGRAGRIGGVPNRNCRPDLMVAAASRLGSGQGQVPMLWIYAENDSFFAPEQVSRVHAAYIAAGGRAALVALGPHGQDGHALFTGRMGSLTWGPIVEQYLRARGLPWMP